MPSTKKVAHTLGLSTRRRKAIEKLAVSVLEDYYAGQEPAPKRSISKKAIAKKKKAA